MKKTIISHGIVGAISALLLSSCGYEIMESAIVEADTVLDDAIEFSKQINRGALNTMESSAAADPRVCEPWKVRAFEVHKVVTEFREYTDSLIVNLDMIDNPYERLHTKYQATADTLRAHLPSSYAADFKLELTEIESSGPAELFSLTAKRAQFNLLMNQTRILREYLGEIDYSYCGFTIWERVQVGVKSRNFSGGDSILITLQSEPLRRIAREDYFVKVESVTLNGETIQVYQSADHSNDIANISFSTTEAGEYRVEGSVILLYEHIGRTTELPFSHSFQVIK